MDFYSSGNNFLRSAHRAASLSISSDFLHTIDQVDSGLMLQATSRIHARVTSKRRMEEDLLLRGGASNIMFLLFRSHIGSRACCREVKIPNQYGGVILWCLFM